MPSPVAKVRLLACRKWPAASAAILTLYPVKSDRVPTLAVDDKWRLYWNPEFTEKLEDEEAAWLILHEVSHLILDHHRRAKDLLPERPEDLWSEEGIHFRNMLLLWNMATDMSINHMLCQEGASGAIEQGVFASQYGIPEGKSAEYNFRELVRQYDSGQLETVPVPVSALSGEDPQEGEGESQKGKSGKGKVSAPVYGSCADGIERRWDEPAPEDDGGAGQQGQEQKGKGAGQEGKPEPPPALSNAEAQCVRLTVVEKVKERGTGGANEILDIPGLTRPKVDPKRKILQMVRAQVERTAGVGERSFHRPSRRTTSPNSPLPSNFCPVPRITVVIDTSQSMSESELRMSAGLVQRVLESFRIRDGIKVITGDTQGKSEQVTIDSRKIEFRGGGGTDMGALIVEAAAKRPKPHLIVVCTDGETPWPERPVGVPVLVCLTSSGYRHWPVPEWMEKVQIYDE